MRVLASAVVLPWEQRTAILRAVIIPLLAATAVALTHEVGTIRLPLADWGWLAIYALATSWFAVCVHRFVLLDPAGARERFSAATLIRVALYAVLIAAIWAMLSGLTEILSLVGIALWVDHSHPAHAPLETFIQQTRVSLAALFISAAIVAVICGRMCLLLPAMAVDGDARAALHVARGNTLRLTVVFSLLPAAFCVLSALQDEESIVETGLLIVLGAILAVVEMVALSLSYRELTAPAPPPTHPPA